MKVDWHLKQPDGAVVSALMKSLGCDPVVAAILANRNIRSPEGARRFLEVSLRNLRPPFAIKDMDRAVQRIARAIMDREKILIFGDYDVDGITATTLLLEFLHSLGADVSHYIPHRTEEGYDLQPAHIYGVALPREIDLVITVDCGSSRHDTVAAAESCGIDLVITDHHTVSEPPAAAAVVNPKRPDCRAGFDDLAGVGVAFALAVSLRKHLRDRGFFKQRPEPDLKTCLDLVMLGTIADMVPVLGDNRILSRSGLGAVNAGNRPGLRALVQASGLAQGAVDAEDVAFRLAPRLNAAGRMGHADDAVTLLTSRHPGRAEDIARRLNQLNRERQETESRILDNILTYLARHPETLDRDSLVLAHPDWHEGVLGIVCAKLIHRFYRPVILISSGKTIGKGSGRSIPGINLHEAIRRCEAHLEAFGGHPMAAGLSIHRDRIPLFQEAFDSAVRELGRDSAFVKTLDIDCELALSRISPELLDQLDRIAPHGEGNPEPLFMARNVRVVDSRIIGKQHRKMTLRQAETPTDRPVEAIQFNVDLRQLPDRFDKVAFRLRWNRWNGRKSPQMIIENV